VLLSLPFLRLFVAFCGHSSSVRNWLTGVVFREAERIYGTQSFDRLPELVAALERAGCDDAGLLSHLRKSGSHCRGCWALDRLTGRY
jgi:hypothetical protein